VKKDQLAFLIAGVAFGVLFGYALFNAVEKQPLNQAQGTPPPVSAPQPGGPPAPTQTGGGSAPMMQEINALKQALQQDPDNLQAMLRLAGIYSQVGMWDQADPLFTRAAEAHPGDHKLIVDLAHIYHDNGRFEGAIGYYRKALETTPDDPNLITDMGICFKELGDFGEALALFERAQGKDPTHWQSLFNIAVVSGFDLGRVDEAVQAVDKLQRVKPDAPGAAELREALLRKKSEAAASSDS
jgi:tetratricopeptide (TPR) repeat protein